MTNKQNSVDFSDLSRWQVSPDSGLSCFSTTPIQPDIDAVKNQDYESELKQVRRKLAYETAKLQASRSHSLLLVFQATDAAGKDSAIREVLQKVNVNATRVAAFKRPTPLELRHDFLWRCARQLPARGEVVVFNRSYYEEVTTVRVHPEYLGFQYPGETPPELAEMDAFWQQRFTAINAFEQHLSNSRTLVLKFWLNMSADEQLKRFQRRLDKPDKRWKFNPADLEERPFWDAYQNAYQQALKATSTPQAPWFAIPADNKDYARWQIAKTIHSVLQRTNLSWPQADFDLQQARELLDSHR